MSSLDTKTADLFFDPGEVESEPSTACPDQGQTLVMEAPISFVTQARRDAAIIAPTPQLEDILGEYDRVCVMFSAGKDSVALVTRLLDAGYDRSKIELHHHIVDGREGSTLMDWPVTEDYSRQFAKAFELPIYYSWREGGFEREMSRDLQRTAPVHWETIGNEVRVKGGDRGELSTRLRFPQLSSDLSVRWCSSYQKIDVSARLLVNDERFTEGKTLVLTGERAEESTARSKYKVFEPHRCDLRYGKKVKRHIDTYRAVHGWTEQQVWDSVAKYRINPHPAYRLGWGRCSCQCCIFGSANQWATIRKFFPAKFEAIARKEELYGYTIHRSLTVRQLADKGVPYDCDPDVVRLAMSESFYEPIIVENWQLPIGAFKESNGPT